MMRTETGRHYGHARDASRAGGRRLLWCAAMMAPLWAPAAPAVVVDPFFSHNQNPLIQVYGLPSMESGLLVEAGARELTLHLNIANSSISQQNSRERIVLDGETYRAIFAARVAYGQGFEWGVDIPLILHDAGVFDNFIEGWHDTFGLTNSRRLSRESNILEYRYERDGMLYYDVRSRRRGIGDILVHAGVQLVRNTEGPRRALAVRTGIKLPTGDPNRLTGSDGIDLSLRLTYLDERLLSRLHSALFAAAGVARLGAGGVLEEMRRDYVGFASIGVVTPVWRSLNFKAQMDLQGSVYDSDLEELGKASTQLTVGGDFDLSETRRLDFGLVENLFTDTTPDLVFMFTYRDRL